MNLENMRREKLLREVLNWRWMLLETIEFNIKPEKISHRSLQLLEMPGSAPLNLSLEHVSNGADNA